MHVRARGAALTTVAWTICEFAIGRCLPLGVFLCNPRRAKMNPRINGYQKMDPGERERETESLSSHVSSAGAPGPSMPIRAPGPGARPRAPGRAAAVVGRDDGLIEATASAGPFGGP